MDRELIKEVKDAIKYAYSMEMATGYYVQDRPNWDNILRKLGKLECSKNI